MQAPEVQELPLRDLHLPAEPGFWPLAPGWWLVLAILLVLLVFLLIKLNKLRLKNKRFKSINQQLGHIEFEFSQHKSHHKLAADISAFMRRFVRYQLNNIPATSLIGQDWIEYLNKNHPNKSFAVFQEALSSGAFQPNTDFDAAQLINVTREFIKQAVIKPNKLEAEHV